MKNVLYLILGIFILSASYYGGNGVFAPETHHQPKIEKVTHAPTCPSSKIDPSSSRGCQTGKCQLLSENIFGNITVAALLLTILFSLIQWAAKSAPVFRFYRPPISL
jgi:hypothetical protein